MRTNPDDFTPFLYLEDGNFDKYCNDIENTASWGGQLEVKHYQLIIIAFIDMIKFLDFGFSEIKKSTS